MNSSFCAIQSRQLIAGLQSRYAERQRHSRGLKIRHNNVIGYYIEVQPKHGDKLVDDIRAEPKARPAPSSIARPWPTPCRTFAYGRAGRELEDRIRSAADKALALELSICSADPGDVEVLTHRGS